MSRLEELAQLIRKYDHAYFTENQSLISDEEYDKLWFELKDLVDKANAKSLTKIAMPLGVQTSHLDKVTHDIPVLSLDKLKIDSPAFSRQLNKFCETYVSDCYSLQSKLDGLTIVTYKRNAGVTHATRGGSIKGENVTEQLLFDKQLTDATSKMPRGMIVRSEAIITREQFAKIVQSQKDNVAEMLAEIEDVPQELREYCEAEFISAEMKAEMNALLKELASSVDKRQLKKLKEVRALRDAIYSNARNLASAALRTKDTSMAEKYGVKLIAYDIMNAEKFGLKTETEILDKLTELGFETVKHQELTQQALHDFLSDETKVNDWRNGESVEIDGLVIKPNERGTQVDDGHHQKNHIAVKFVPQGAETILRDIVWTHGNEGRMTPIAVFDPVFIGGSQIRKASLGSWPNAKSLGLYPNAGIYVVRSNDVIPQVKRVLEEKAFGFELPDGAELRVDDKGRGGIVYDTNYVMPLEEQLNRFAIATDMKAAKLSSFKKLVDANVVDSLYDFVSNLASKREQMLALRGFNVKTVDALIEEVDLVMQHLTLEQLIKGLSITGLGKESIKRLVEMFPMSDDILEMTADDLQEFSEVQGVNKNAVSAVKTLQTNDDFKSIAQLVGI